MVMVSQQQQQSLLYLFFTVTSLVTVRNVAGFQLTLPSPVCGNGRSAIYTSQPFEADSAASSRMCHPHSNNACRKGSTKLCMVRNIDLPEAIVFYGVESMMTPQIDEGSNAQLRPGVVRLLNECQEVGTAALLLSEELKDEEGVRLMLLKAWEQSSDTGDGQKMLEKLTKDDDPVISFQCLQSKFTIPASHDDGTADTDLSDEYDESIELYNLQANGRSPSPAFLLDSLRSVRIDPRGFGGSSGFARGQWIEPRRSPMPARVVVFIAGDWTSSSNSISQNIFDNDEEKSSVKDRCAAARAAGCRVIYLEQLSDEYDVQDDDEAMSLCDAVVDTFGNDNPRDLQPITLDAISTPGDYWLNPPTPRDDVGNAVAIDEIVEWFRSEREMEEVLADGECVVPGEDVDGDEMSEEEMNKILADLDSL